MLVDSTRRYLSRSSPPNQPLVFLEVTQMYCTSCGSKNLRSFRGEIAVHFPGLSQIDEPALFVFPDLVICLVCGVAQFAVPEAELRLLAAKANMAA